MSSRERKTSPLALGCAVLFAITALLISAVVIGLATGLISVRSGGSVTLPNGASVEIVTDTSGFAAGEDQGESYVTLGSFGAKTYRFTKTEVTRDGRVLGQLAPAEKSLTLEATDGAVELRSDETGRVIFLE